MQNNGFLHQYIVLQNVQVCNFHVKDNLDLYLRGYLLVRPFLLRLWQFHEKLVRCDHQSHGAESNNDFKWAKQVMK